MTSYLQTNSTSMVTLMDGDELYVPQNVVLATGTSDAILSSNSINLFIQVDGTVVSQQEEAVYLGSAPVDAQYHIVVGQTGIVRGGVSALSDYGVFTTGNTYLSTAGQISAARALTFSGVEDAVIHNSGNIDGLLGEAIIAYAGSNLILTNSGEITGATFGVFVSEEQAKVNNSGVIHGTTEAAISAVLSASLDIKNTGLIGTIDFDTAIDGDDQKDRVINSGTIEGHVKLGGGGDVYKGRQGGAVDGTVFGNAGNDKLNGGLEDDVLYGGADNDSIKGRAGDDTLVGGGEHDELIGNRGEDVLKGGGGSDTIHGGKDDDVLTGNGGSDYFVFGRNDGHDLINDFTDGVDKLDFSTMGFANKAAALGKFFEIGSGANDKVGFEYKGTSIVIKGIDLSDLNNGDLLV